MEKRAGGGQIGIKQKRGSFNQVKSLLQKGTVEGVFPGAVLLVAGRGEILFSEGAGFLSLIPEKLPMKTETIFDLASLTKPLATTLAIMKLADQGKINIDQPLKTLLPEPLPDEKKAITPRLLLCHSAGLIDWKPFYLNLEGHDPVRNKALLRERVMGTPLHYASGQGDLYSDLGFMILEWVIEEVTGMTLPRYLDEHFFGPLLLKTTFFNQGNKPPRYSEDRFAATEECPWRKKVIRGIVHDENAYAVGGYSGHAGLFGTAQEVYAIINLLRAHYLGNRSDFFNPETVRAFFKRQKVLSESTWALGWDTPSPEGSSAGRYFSEQSVGHLGFTGTSIWMDLERDVQVILLTNRIHPTRNNVKIRAFRPKMHDAIMEAIIH